MWIDACNRLMTCQSTDYTLPHLSNALMVGIHNFLPEIQNEFHYQLEHFIRRLQENFRYNPTTYQFFSLISLVSF